jgi:hypothetical protein
MSAHRQIRAFRRSLARRPNCANDVRARSGTLTSPTYRLILAVP